MYMVWTVCTAVWFAAALLNCRIRTSVAFLLCGEAYASFTCRHLLSTADSLLSSAWYGCWCPDCIFFACVDFVVELQLDSVKLSQKESVRRTLFLDSQQPSLVVNLSLSDGGRSCHDTQIYLRVSQMCFFLTLFLQKSDQRVPISTQEKINACSCARVNSGLQITLM